MNKFWVYILEVKNGNFYTGYTNDLERRLKQHQQGTSACKFTRAFGPVKLLQSWEISGAKGDAMKIEAFIKKQNRKTKEALVREPKLLDELYAPAAD